MTVNTEPNGEQTAEHVVEIQAPKYLDTSKNCLEQPPFDTLLELTNQKTQIPIEHLRLLLIRLSTSALYINPYENYGEDKALVNKLRQSKGLEELRFAASKVIPDKEAQKRYANCALKMGEALSSWPYWDEYFREGLPFLRIVNIGQTDGYDQFGNYNAVLESSDSLPKDSPPSYAYWLFLKKRMDQRHLVLGIDEVFPDNTAMNPTIKTHNMNHASRTWRIKTNTNLLPPKK